ncbi:9304_t:CDS:2, partial [Gigaspora margarita]
MTFKYISMVLLLLFSASVVYSACDYTTKCKCIGPHPQGQYCGTAGSPGCDPTHVYECSPEGNICDYGYRVS